MNRTILTAAAGLMLASLAVSGAHADGTKNFTVRAGGFFPTDGDAKRALGNTWFSFGGDVVVKNTQAGAITSAATPEGTFCSAQCSVPCPTRKNRNPSKRPARQASLLGRSPFRHAHASRIAPAIKWRVAAVRNGGIVSTA